MPHARSAATSNWLLIKTFLIGIQFLPLWADHYIAVSKLASISHLMLFGIIALLFAASTYALHPVAHQTFSSTPDLSTKCATALAQMVYPPTTCLMQYLQRVSQTLQVQSPLLFTRFANQVITNFASQYNVVVFITDAMGNNTPYPFPDTGSFATLPPSWNTQNGVSVSDFMAMFTSTAQANVIGQGFMNNNGYTYYTFVVWSQTGQLLYVNVGAPTNNNQFC